MEYKIMKVSANGKSYFVTFHQQDNRLPNLLLLHGFMGSGQVFCEVVKQLRSFCNPVTIDLLGHGKTDKADSPERFFADNQIADLCSVITQMFDEPPFLHGYSMGGRLALRYAINHPSTIRGLILESTHYGLEDKNNIRQRKQTDELRAQAIEDDFKSFLKKWQHMPLFEKGISLPVEKLNSYHSIQERQDPMQMANSLRGFGAARMPSVKLHLKNINKPVLLIAGQADLKYAEIAQKMHEEIAESTLSIIPNAGHRVHLEHPKAFISEIKSFITKN